MKSFPILCTLFCSIISYSQETNYIKFYYPYINQAEYFIVKNNFPKALLCYQKAFEKVTHCFAKDEYNALLCSILANRKESNYYMERLALKGVKLDFLEKNMVIKKKFLTNDKRNKYKECYKERSSFDSILIMKLQKLEKLDQDIRSPNHLHMSNIWKTDSSNAKSLLDIIYDQGFPSEELIGYEGILPNENLYSLIIIHQNRLSGYFNFSTVLLDAVRQGRLLPNTALLLMFFQDEMDSIGFSYTSATKNIKGTINSQLIDKARIDWGIAPVNEYAQKINFYNHANFEFNNKKLSIEH